MASVLPLPEPLWKTASPEVQAAILALVAYYEQRIEQLETRVKDLENQLKLNSTNSSQPPSSDSMGRKRKPPAPPSRKRHGGQPGHPKARRALVPPDVDDPSRGSRLTGLTAHRCDLPRGHDVRSIPRQA